VDGGSGDETLRGTKENDRIDGGAGNDTLQGGAGNDTYLFGAGSGQDTISDIDATAGNTDTLRLKTGLAPTDVTLWRDNANLCLGINGISDQVTVQGWFDDPANRMEQIQFADGTVWDVAILEAAKSKDIIGAAGNDTLTGTTGADTLDGGAGRDKMSGGKGDDT
jgi:Ca2+-binding RTX toxin-like protein